MLNKRCENWPAEIPISAGFHSQLADKGGLIQHNEYNQRQKRGNEHSIAPVICRLMTKFLLISRGIGQARDTKKIK